MSLDQDCRLSRLTNFLRRNNTALQWEFITFRGADANATDEVVTDPIEIRLFRKDWSVSASQEFHAKVLLVDEKGNNVSEKVHIDVHPEKSGQVRLGTPSHIFLVSNSRIKYLKVRQSACPDCRPGVKGREAEKPCQIFGLSVTQTNPRVCLETCFPAITNPSSVIKVAGFGFFCTSERQGGNLSISCP